MKAHTAEVPFKSQSCLKKSKLMLVFTQCFAPCCQHFSPFPSIHNSGISFSVSPSVPRCSPMFLQRCTVCTGNAETKKTNKKRLSSSLCLPCALFCGSSQKCCFAFLVQMCFLSSPCVAHLSFHPFPRNVILFL